jgi:hypothetical protein
MKSKLSSSLTKLLFLSSSFLFFNAICSDDEGGGSASDSTTITVQVSPNSQVEACDNKYPNIGGKDVSISIAVYRFNQDTGNYEPYRNSELDFRNKWGREDASALRFTIKAPRADAFKVYVVANQECSDCCYGHCANNGPCYPQFYGEQFMDIGSTYVAVPLIWQTQSCGC